MDKLLVNWYLQLWPSSLFSISKITQRKVSPSPAPVWRLAILSPSMAFLWAVIHP